MKDRTETHMGNAKNSTPAAGAFEFSRPSEDSLLLKFSGIWTTRSTLPPSTDIDKAFSSAIRNQPDLL